MRVDRPALCIISVLAALACGESVEPPPPRAALVEVTSAIDTLVAVGRTAQLTAAGRDAEGDPVTGLTFTWTSSDAAVISVSAIGLATAHGPGSATITATTEGPVAGAVRLRALQADLPGVMALAGDPFAAAVLGALSSAARTTAEAAWDDCASGATTGGLVDVVACVGALRAQAAAAPDPTDRTLLAVVVLFAGLIEERLGL